MIMQSKLKSSLDQEESFQDTFAYEVNASMAEYRNVSGKAPKTSPFLRWSQKYGLSKGGLSPYQTDYEIAKAITEGRIQISTETAEYTNSEVGRSQLTELSIQNLEASISAFYRLSRRDMNKRAETRSKNWFMTIMILLPLECFVLPEVFLNHQVLQRLNLVMIKSENTKYNIALSKSDKIKVLEEVLQYDGTIESKDEKTFSEFFVKYTEQFNGWIFINNSARGHSNLELARCFMHKQEPCISNVTEEQKQILCSLDKIPLSDKVKEDAQNRALIRERTKQENLKKKQAAQAERASQQERNKISPKTGDDMSLVQKGTSGIEPNNKPLAVAQETIDDGAEIDPLVKKDKPEPLEKVSSGEQSDGGEHEDAPKKDEDDNDQTNSNESTLE